MTTVAVMVFTPFISMIHLLKQCESKRVKTSERKKTQAQDSSSLRNSTIYLQGKPHENTTKKRKNMTLEVFFNEKYEQQIEMDKKSELGQTKKRNENRKIQHHFSHLDLSLSTQIHAQNVLNALPLTQFYGISCSILLYCCGLRPTDEELHTKKGSIWPKIVLSHNTIETQIRKFFVE